MHYCIPVARPNIGEEEIQNVVEAMKSGWISSKGPFIQRFEEEFSRYIDVSHAVAVSNGTAALHLALIALGIGRGDEVIVPSLTFVAAPNAIMYTGATPIFVDSNPDYWCADPDAIDSSITSKTKAILLVHLYGHPCDIHPILEMSRRRGVHVIEDCAEALGAEYRGRKVGCFGDVSCFSFYANKTITTGEGGMCATNSRELAEKIRILKDHGMNPKRRYWHDVIGFNYRMTNLQAAIGVSQLRKIEALVRKKREIAKNYQALIGQNDGIVHAPEMVWAKNVYWLYSILLDSKVRDKVAMELDGKGMETRPFFYPAHKLPAYNHDPKLPVAEQLSSRGLNLPSGPRIGEDEIRDVASVLRNTLTALEGSRA